MRGSKKSVAASRVLISNQLHSAIRPVIEQLESRQLLSASVPLASMPAATPAVLTGTVIGTAGSYQNDGNTIAKVFDGNLTNYFDGPTASGDYAGLDLGVGNLITQISYAPRVGYASRMVGGVFQGSDSADFSSALTTLYTVTAAPASGVFTTVSVSNASPFRYVRYLAPDGSYGDVAEVQFTGYAPPTGATLVNGTLAVYGTNNADTITVETSAYELTVTLDGITTSFSTDNVQNIVIAALGGDDNITENYFGAGDDTTGPPSSILGGDGNDTIDLYIGEDVGDTQFFVDGGAGNDTIFADGDGDITMHGGDGNDSMTAEGVDGINGAMYGDEGNDTLTDQINALISLYGGPGNDTLSIDGYAAGGILSGGDGIDTLDLGLNYNTQTDTVNFDGKPDSNIGMGEGGVSEPFVIAQIDTDFEIANITGAGDTPAVVNLDSATTQVNFIITATVNSSSGNDTLTFLNSDALVNCGSGNNIVTFDDSTGTINGGTGNDTLYADISEPATINGGGGDDTAYINPNVDTVTNVANVIDYPSVSGTVTGLGNNSETIYLDANNNSTLDSGELSALVSSNGTYTITGVPAGNYIVRQVLPSGVTQTSPAGGYGIHVTVTATSALMNENFTDASTPADSTITVNGTSGDDTININFDNDTFTVDVDGTTQSYSAAGVESLVVNALGGTNTVTIDGSYDYGSASDVFSNISVIGGSGNDTLHTSINDNAQVNGQGINVNFTGGDGNDYADIEGGDTATISDGNGSDSFYTQAVQDNLSFGITAGNGNDSVVVGSVGGSSSQYGTANLGTGVDSFVNQDIDDHTTVNVDGHSLALSASTAEIVGHVLSASTGNGISGVQVYLDNNGDGTFDAGDTATTTDSNGVYVFDGLQPSPDTESTPYTVRVTLPTGYVAAAGTPVTQSESLAGGNGVSGIDFYLTYATGGSVSGSVTGGQTGETVYLDANNNSTFDSGELSTTLASNGTFSFTSVPGGTYVVRQVLPSGTTQTSPTMDYGDHVTVTNGSSSIGNNFTDKAPATGGSVSGTITGGVAGETIYLDANNNSVLDSGELSTTTSSTGAFTFSNVPIGAYVVRQVLPSGTTQTSPADNYGDHVSVTNGSNSTGNNFTDTTAHVQLTGTTIGTAGSYDNSGNTIAKATDGNLSTFFDGQASNGNYVGLDLGSSKTITQIAYAPRSGYASRMIGGEFQISTTADFSSGVTTIYTITVTPASELTTLTLSSPVTARYIRYLSPNSSHGDIAEFEVFG